MPTVNTRLKRLTDPQDPRFVSMVTRAASGMHFRIVKSDDGEDMNLDLAKLPLTRVLKGNTKNVNETAAPRVSGFVVLPEDKDLALECIQKAGFAVDKVTTTEDGSILVAQDDKPEEGADLVKVSDNLVLVMKGFRPWAADLQGFQEQIGVDGYYEGVGSACSALRTCISKAVYKANTQDEAVKAVQTILVDFSKYVSGLISGIPSAAFKADDLVTVAKADLAQVEADEAALAEAEADGFADDEDPLEDLAEVDGEDEGGEGEVEQTTEATTETTTSTETPATQATQETDVSKTQTTATPATTETTPAETVQKTAQAPSEMAQVLAALQGLTSKVEGFQGQLETVQKGLTETKAQVQETIQKADKTAEAVRGTVIAAAQGGDDTARQVVQKSAGARSHGLPLGDFDTAFVKPE